jgi:AraC family transcriptional regulator of adaptative response/methylated-DNA-[protein]-cysteine methyltransferase
VSASRLLDRATCDRARLARDARFDGRFFTGVLTTRIYCRPTCPVKPARSRNVVFFPTAAAAERGLRLIAQGFLDDGKGVEDLAATLGMTPRHLRRLFARHAGAPPTAVATTRRVQRAKALLDTTLPMSAVAFGAGFASIRRFNAAFRAAYRRPPSAVRRHRRSRAAHLR